MLEAYKQRVMVDFVNNNKNAIMTSQEIADELRSFVSLTADEVTRFMHYNGVLLDFEAGEMGWILPPDGVKAIPEEE